MTIPNALLLEAKQAWRPPPRLTVSEWAEQYRHLSPEASAEHGPWSNDSAKHLVAPMDALSPYDPCERVVCKFSSQTGKTEIMLNFIGYIIDLDPGPILAIQPNVTPMGEAFSKDRVNPMLRDSPSLAKKVATLKGRSSASTIMHKQFNQGHLTIAGSNSPAGLASRPIRYLAADEIGRWEVTKEGDALVIARKRQQTFRSRRRSKELNVSSPTYDDLGISAEYSLCTQQWEWQLICPDCVKSQFPSIEHFQWQETAKSAKYACQHCGTLFELDREQEIKDSGTWVCTKDGERRYVGFWMNQFASPFARWDETIAEWIEAQGDQAKMQVVTNTAFAQDWEGVGDRVQAHILRTREEEYASFVPDGVCTITVGADVQQDRIEAEIVGWGKNRENWSLGYYVYPGEPTSEEVWDDLYELYALVYDHPNGAKIKAAKLCVDSGAFTQHVYDFIKRKRDRNIIPVKGVSGMTRDQIDNDETARIKRTAKRIRNGKPPEILGVDAIKRTVYQFLVAEPGKPGYSHFPAGRTDEYYDQLTGERLVTVQVRGKRPQRRWKTIHHNVEALDCRVYAYAGFLFTNPSTITKPKPPVQKQVAVHQEAEPWQKQQRPRQRQRMIR